MVNIQVKVTGRSIAAGLRSEWSQGDDTRDKVTQYTDDVVGLVRDLLDGLGDSAADRLVFEMMAQRYAGQADGERIVQGTERMMRLQREMRMYPGVWDDKAVDEAYRRIGYKSTVSGARLDVRELAKGGMRIPGVTLRTGLKHLDEKYP